MPKVVALIVGRTAAASSFTRGWDMQSVLTFPNNPVTSMVIEAKTKHILVLGTHSSSEALLPRAAAALGRPAAGGLPALGLGAPRARFGAFSAACAHQTKLSKQSVALLLKDHCLSQ